MQTRINNFRLNKSYYLAPYNILHRKNGFAEASKNA